MKKKITITSILAVLLLSITASSAFAWVGTADTKSQAIALFTPQIFQGYITAGTDDDWFSWTNDQGPGVSFSLSQFCN